MPCLATHRVWNPLAAEANVGGDRDLLDEMLGTWTRHRDALTDALLRALAREDAETAAEALSKLKEALQVLAAESSQEAIFHLEENLEAETAEVRPMAVEELLDNLDCLQVELDQWRTGDLQAGTSLRASSPRQSMRRPTTGVANGSVGHPRPQGGRHT